MKLSKTDSRILQSYIGVLEGLADYLSDCYEIVLHSLENVEHSAICVINGEHTGRQAGAPITNLAVDMLREMESTGRDHVVYFSSNKKGEPLKSTTIAIRGENKRIIGLICINMYLNVPLNHLLRSLVPADSPGGSHRPEAYAQNISDLVIAALEKERARVMADESILPRNKNKAIVEGLYDSGILQYKEAVMIVMEKMGISRNTIYMHIRNYKKKTAT